MMSERMGVNRSDATDTTPEVAAPELDEFVVDRTLEDGLDMDEYRDNADLERDELHLKLGRARNIGISAVDRNEES